MTPQDTTEQKKVEFYAAAVNAWMTTGLERDRSLLALSAGGIAVLVTLVSTLGVGSAAEMLLYIAALASFLVCIVTVLVIFKRNATYLLGVIHGTGPDDDPVLKWLDLTAGATFAVALLLSFLIGASAAIESYKKGNSMTKATKTQIRESVNGAGKLQPDYFERSLNGAAKLQPQQDSGQSSTGSTGSTGANTPAAEAPQPTSGDKKE